MKKCYLPKALKNRCVYLEKEPINKGRGMTWKIIGATIEFYDRLGQKWILQKEVMDCYFPAAMNGLHGVSMEIFGFRHASLCKDDPW